MLEEECNWSDVGETDAKEYLDEYVSCATSANTRITMRVHNSDRSSIKRNVVQLLNRSSSCQRNAKPLARINFIAKEDQPQRLGIIIHRNQHYKVHICYLMQFLFKARHFLNKKQIHKLIFLEPNQR